MKVNIVERVGDTLKSLLVRSNPWGSMNCPHPDCMPCKSLEKNYSCMRRNVTYMTSCELCKEEGLMTAYISGSSNFLYERTSQHICDSQDSDKKTHMRRHTKEKHPGMTPNEIFTVKQIIPHITALTRQMEEDFLINQFNKGVLLNTKYKYHHGILPSITTTDFKSHVVEPGPNPAKMRIMEQQFYFEDKKKKLSHEDSEDKRPKKIRKLIYHK